MKSIFIWSNLILLMLFGSALSQPILNKSLNIDSSAKIHLIYFNKEHGDKIIYSNIEFIMLDGTSKKEFFNKNIVIIKDKNILSGKISMKIEAIGNLYYYKAQIDTVLANPQSTMNIKVYLSKLFPRSYEGWCIEAKENIKNGKVKLILVGNRYFCPPLDQQNELAKKYGYEIKHICTLQISDGIELHDGYNKIINQYLDKRNGKNWRKQYVNELNELCKKYKSN